MQIEGFEVNVKDRSSYVQTVADPPAIAAKLLLEFNQPAYDVLRAAFFGMHKLEFADGDRSFSAYVIAIAERQVHSCLPEKEVSIDLISYDGVLL
jgi:hypothetical protein